MQAEDDHKLHRLMEQSGLFDSDDNSTGSDWSPTISSKEERIISEAARRQDPDEIYSPAKKLPEFASEEPCSSKSLIPTNSLKNKCGITTADRIIIVAKNKKIKYLPPKRVLPKTRLSLVATQTQPFEGIVSESDSSTQSESILQSSLNLSIPSCSKDSSPKHQEGILLINPETGLLESTPITRNESQNICEQDPPADCALKTSKGFMKRKLINPETGALEDEVDTDLSVPKILKCRRLLNPESGLIEDVEEETHNTEELKENKIGKKKRKTPKSWKRSKAKEGRLKDHIRRKIPKCRCNCSNKITDLQAEKIHKKFVNYSNHTEQNIYLQGCVKEEMPKRYRPRKKHARPRRNFKYTLTCDNKSITVCSSAFLAIHGIKRDRLKKKVLQNHKDIEDGRGKHDNHPRKVPVEAIDRIYDYIANLPSEASHYSRTDNKHRKYLSANLNIAKLHRMFLEINPDLKNVVKYEKFRDIFNHDFNLSFGSPRKDICNVCEKFKVDIKSAELEKDEDRLKNLKAERDLHLEKAQIFFDKLESSESNMDDNVLSICFDYQKNLPLPVTNIQDEYYRRQLWLYNFGVRNLKEKTATMYLSTENYVRKGPNEVITALNDYIQINKKPEHTQLIIFCDNCFSQNKNKYLFAFLDQMCSRGVFENVTVVYPIPGHSMMPIDRDFGQIELKRVREQTVYTPEYYVDMIKDCRITKPYEIVFLEKNLRRNYGEERIVKVKDYKKLYDNFVKPIPGISTCREVKFHKRSRPTLRSTITEPFKPFTLYRVGVQRTIRIEPENAYDAPLRLKQGKIADILYLLNYVCEDERYFYADILPADENTAGQEELGDSEDDKE